MLDQSRITGKPEAIHVDVQTGFPKFSRQTELTLKESASE
jgi:hypothetical protein